MKSRDEQGSISTEPKIWPNKLVKVAPDKIPKIFLGHYDEAVGKFLGLEKDESWLTVRLSCGDLTFSADSLEAKILSERLTGLSDRSVGILRTDSAERPLAVRVLMDGAVA